jgi:phosphonate transport system substrate-binding protein
VLALALGLLLPPLAATAASAASTQEGPPGQPGPRQAPLHPRSAPAPGQPPTTTGQDAPALRPLRFGSITLSHPLMMYRQYLPFTDYVSARIGTPIELVLAKDYETIINDLVNGDIDMALLGALSYLEARDACPRVTPLCAALSNDGTPTNRTIFFTRADRGDINTLDDLRGKRMALADLHSTSGYLHPLCYMGRRGILLADLASADNLRTHEAAARSVLRGTHEVGAISKATYERFEHQGLKVIAETEPHPGFVIVGRGPGIPELERFRDYLLGLDFNSPVLKEEAERWSPVLKYGFITIPDKNYTRIRELLECARTYGHKG